MISLPTTTLKTSSPSKGVRFHIGGIQAAASGGPRDISLAGNHPTINGGTTDAAICANAGWITTAAIDNQGANANGGGLTVGGSGANAVGGFNLYDEASFIFVATVVANSANYNMGFIGNSSGGTPGLSIGQAGNSGGNQGGMSIALRDNSGNVYNPSVEAQFQLASGGLKKIVVLANGNKTAIEAVDTAVRTMRIFGESANGGMSELTLANAGSLAAVINSTLPSYGFGFGHTGQPAASGTFGSRQRHMGLYVLPKGFFPKSAKAVAAWYSVHPDVVIPEALAGY